MILSYHCWQRAFHGDPGIIGRTLLVNNVAFTVVGVTRESFPFEPGMLRGGWVWMPMAMSPVLEPGMDRLHAHQDGRTRVYFFGRLKPGVTFAQAKGELMNLAARYAELFLPRDPRRTLWPNFLSHGFAFFPWNNDDVKVNVIGIFTLTGVVLLVACANVANLLLARATTRQREISVRLALGARRGRVVRQLLTESLMIACLGAAVAVLVGVWCSGAFWPWLLDLNLTPEMHRFFDLDWHMAGYAFALAGVTGIVFGIVPALEGARANIHAALKQENTMFGQRVSRSRLRGLLVTGQIAVSVTFLILATLAVRMVLQKTNTDFAFDAKRVGFFGNNTAPNARAARHPQQFQSELLERIRALPGVTSASLGDVWDGRDVNPNHILVDGQAPDNAPRVNESLVEPAYFQTLGVSLMRGRLFTVDDAKSHAPVFVVSETFAEKFWPGQDAVGRRLRIGRERVEGEVIGVVKDGARAIRDRYGFRAFVGDLYSPLWPDSKEFAEIWVRAEGDMSAVMRTVAAEARSLDPEALLQPRGTLQQIHDEWKKRTLLICAIVVTLGGLALLLAAMGVYGVMAYAVAQRTHEIGVRMAMGAPRGAIVRLVLVEGVRLVTWGIGIGALGCALVAWIARSRLYGLSPIDPVTFGGISLLLVAVALLACWFPARRAARVNPMVALRCE